ncbi:hypothetical protein DOTSEDRAFT_28876 [Dothistroma septosporum NZE10]|uniref:Uncharacterized protein n=1 Tax=Dothistroma septosporum (strain NZE10 / CBS 128990) TaxID=675120 RepID=M2WI09_DOTSN|nr:hypothetical protein DOTSEDRAFT_28876 [Dothistroma septosporum NZE10]
MGPTLQHFMALLMVVQVHFSASAAHKLGTVIPCPKCAHPIAPKPITVTAQYQTVSTCTPSPTTISSTHTSGTTTLTTTVVKTVPSCSTYAWVSTRIPTHSNTVTAKTLVTTTNQPVTFGSSHYVETHTTTITAPYYRHPGHHRNITSHRNATRNHTTTTTTHKTTFDVRSWCDYDSIGPIAIPGYGGSGLCTDCGPDANSAITQRFTVASCSDKVCTTFNETWIASPATYTSSGKTYSTTTTETHCPTATQPNPSPGQSYPVDMPATITLPSPTWSAPITTSTTLSSTSTKDQYQQPTETYSNGQGQQPTTSASSTWSSSTTTTTTSSSTCTDDEDEQPTKTYGGAGDKQPTETYGGGEGMDPSGGMDYESPTPTPYQSKQNSYQVFKRQGLERPRGNVQKRGGLLYYGA